MFNKIAIVSFVANTLFQAASTPLAPDELTLINFILGRGFDAALLVAVIWQHREISRLHARNETLQDRLLDERLKTQALELAEHRSNVNPD